MTLAPRPDRPSPDDAGSVTGAPSVPPEVVSAFTSRFVEANGIRSHVVVGGAGPALYLVGGWPQSWYQWRLVMARLAETFTVVAIDPRGSGLSDKPTDGYDSATLAADVVGIADALGHPSFDLVGHDIGMWTGYALANDYPERLGRLAVVEAIIPGVSTSPPLLGDDGTNGFLWHFAFNRAGEVSERMVSGREEIYFGHQFATKSASAEAPSPEAVSYYIDRLRDPDALRGSFEHYRAIGTIIEQNATRRQTTLSLPVLAVAGALACGGLVGAEMRTVAHDVTEVIIPECGHFAPEEAPEALVAALEEFLLRGRS